MIKRMTYTASLAALMLVPGFAIAQSSGSSDSTGVYDNDEDEFRDTDGDGDIDREDVRGTDADVNDDDDKAPSTRHESGTTVTQPAPGETNIDVNVGGDNDVERTPAPAPAPTRRETGYLDDDDENVNQTVNVNIEEKEDKDEAHKRVGAALMVGGGVSDFGNNAMRDATDPGGEWNVRATIGTRSIIGLEAQYVGAAQDLNSTFGASSNAAVFRNGVEGMLRLNIPLTPGKGDGVLVEPYAMGGAGWTRFDVNGDSGTASINDGDDVLTVPYGGGLAIGVNGFMVDTRFTYRSTFEEDLVGEDIAGTANSDRDLDNWSANALLGYEF